VELPFFGPLTIRTRWSWLSNGIIQ